MKFSNCICPFRGTDGFGTARSLEDMGFTWAFWMTTMTRMRFAIARYVVPLLVLALLPACGGASDAASAVTAAQAGADAPDVVVKVDPAVRHGISPYIYGMNSGSKFKGLPLGAVSLDRTGGNRWTAYNWENNASNAGSDYNFQSDAFLSASAMPGEAVRSLIEGDRAAGMASLIPVPMQGLVSADKAGPVNMRNPVDMTRFKTVVPQKSSRDPAPFTMTPPTSDAFVYTDEFLWALDQNFRGQSIFGASPVVQPAFIELDNEPELWNSTHREIQGAKLITSDEYIAKTLAMTRAIKSQYPGSLIFGPAHFGFMGIYSWMGDLQGVTASGDNWFTDKYLAALKSASAAFGRTLVDVYDLHWYSEATDSAGKRVSGLNGTMLSADEVQAIVQSPRSLWDKTYTEKSWITQVIGAPIFVLPRLQAKINARFPGMKLAITEYNNGGGMHIAGTIAQADNLGIFGMQGLFAAAYWPLSDKEPYSLAGFRAFRDFDGAGANFGDVSLQATSSRVQDVVVYASRDSAHDGRVVFVAINRSRDAQVTQIAGVPLAGAAHLYQMTAGSTQGQANIRPVSAGNLDVTGKSMTIKLPALSVTTIDVY
jgi:hypothetical protein